MSGEGAGRVLDFLRGVALFKELPEADLESLSAMVKEVSLAAGAELFRQGGPGDYAYVIEKGEIEIVKLSDGREVTLAVRRQGEVVGEMALLEKAPRMAGARALSDSVVLAIGGGEFERLLASSPAAARVILATVTARLRETQAMLMQSEKMAQLGILTAGMAHELNNPASAALRGAEQLRRAVEELSFAQERLVRAGLSPDRIDELARRLAQARKSADGPGDASDPKRGETQEAIEQWLEKRGLLEESRRAPDLADIGYTPAGLDELARVYPLPLLQDAIVLISASYVVESLSKEIALGARQITDIVKALKSYVYLDQGPVQEVDIHEGLENTLIILKHKLSPGITVRRDYAQGLPRVSAHASELNQVWTNLIDNAADALAGKGEIVVRTRRRDNGVAVEVEDNGPGIPEDIKSRVFNLFFTTKPLGKGSGQGLNIAYGIVRRHGGEIDFTSRPGKTVFTVRIPVSPPGAALDRPRPHAERRVS